MKNIVNDIMFCPLTYNTIFLKQKNYNIFKGLKKET